MCQESSFPKPFRTPFLAKPPHPRRATVNVRAKSWLSASPGTGETPKSHVDGREIHTVDGRNPKQPLGMYKTKTLVNNGIFT